MADRRAVIKIGDNYREMSYTVSQVGGCCGAVILEYVRYAGSVPESRYRTAQQNHMFSAVNSRRKISNPTKKDFYQELWKHLKNQHTFNKGLAIAIARMDDYFDTREFCEANEDDWNTDGYEFRNRNSGRWLQHFWYMNSTQRLLPDYDV